MISLSDQQITLVQMEPIEDISAEKVRWLTSVRTALGEMVDKVVVVVWDNY